MELASIHRAPVPSMNFLALLLLLSASGCNLKRVKDLENEVLREKIAVTIHPFLLKSPPPDDAWTGSSSYPSSTGRAGVANNDANKARHDTPSRGSKGFPSARLLGPAIHGPAWSVPSHPPVSSSSSVEGTFLWAVGLIGTVQNAATVITVLTSRRCRRPLHLLVGCLAITDLFISTIYIPSYTYFLLETEPLKLDGITEGSPGQEGGNVWNVCVISRTVFIQIASVTLTIKALIAGYLYMYTTSKQTAEKVFTFCNTVVLILGAWFLNFMILFIPRIIGYEQVDFYPNAMLCQKDGKSPGQDASKRSGDVELPFYIYLLSTLALHSIELVVMCVCFVRVHWAINKGRSIWLRKCPVTAEERPDTKMYSRATKTTVLLFVTFSVCWLPIYVTNLLDPLHVSIPTYVHHISMDLLLLKSAINPAIYIYGVRSLRRELQLMCLCRCRDPNARNLKFKAPLTSTFESDEEEEEEGANDDDDSSPGSCQNPRARMV